MKGMERAFERERAMVDFPLKNKIRNEIEYIRHPEKRIYQDAGPWKDKQNSVTKEILGIVLHSP